MTELVGAVKMIAACAAETAWKFRVEPGGHFASVAVVAAAAAAVGVVAAGPRGFQTGFAMAGLA